MKVKLIQAIYYSIQYLTFALSLLGVCSWIRSRVEKNARKKGITLRHYSFADFIPAHKFFLSIIALCLVLTLLTSPTFHDIVGYHNPWLEPDGEYKYYGVIEGRHREVKIRVNHHKIYLIYAMSPHNNSQIRLGYQPLSSENKWSSLGKKDSYLTAKIVSSPDNTVYNAWYCFALLFVRELGLLYIYCSLRARTLGHFGYWTNEKKRS